MDCIESNIGSERSRAFGLGQAHDAARDNPVELYSGLPYLRVVPTMNSLGKTGK